MLKPFIFGLVAAAMVAGSATAAPRNKGKGSDASRMVCKTELELGSKLRRTRACHTQAQWDEMRRQTRATVEIIERGHSRGCNCGT